EQAPDLVDGDGRLRTDLARFGWEIAVRPAVRRQVRAEIKAQFKAFHATGLPLDHVNAHKHYHLHPVIAYEMLSVGQAYGMKGVRVPIEPSRTLAAVEPGRKPSLAWIMAPWARLLARKLSRAGLWSPDAVFGLAWSGQMTTARLAGLINRLPAGCSEIYLHPAMRGGFPFSAPEYRYADELAALTAAETAAAIRSGDIALGGYADFLPAARGRL
ncbi:MAG: ChbG/HpnK family deacetylase, partial [Rhodoplanes sp.]